MIRSTIPIAAAAVLLALAAVLPLRAAEPTAAATAGFDAYVSTIEARLAVQHNSANYLALPADTQSLRSGQPLIETLAPASASLPAAMLHHWRGTAFVPGATAAAFDRLMRAYDAYPRIYSPQVLSARILSRNADRYQIAMRVAQKHVLTVVMDTDYNVTFSQPGPRRIATVSHSTHIAEIDSPGTARERALTPAESHGFLWRLNTYWSAEERDGGLYIQIESVTLSRSIPTGLGWAIGPFVESVPRDSLEFTLTATRNALKLPPNM